MKFNEKLIELRRKEGLSQEELGYKLNVTRQTVSKWELGQTTPEMDKLVEMSKIFNISVDDLINDVELENKTNSSSEPIIEDQPIKKQGNRSNKIYLVLVGALIIVIILIIVKLFTGMSSTNKETNSEPNILERFFGIFDKVISMQEEMLEKQEDMLGNSDEIMNEAQNMIGNAGEIFENTTSQINTTRFNGTLELYNGSNSGLQLKRLLEEAITINKTEDRKITVKYNEIETQDTEEIKNLKMIIKDSNNFEVTFDYDQEGYINEVTIEQVIGQFEISSFNSALEIYAGSKNGMIATTVLDKIITINKTEDRKITVKYSATETQDTEEIKNLKRNFGTFDNCEITYEYDADGFINKAIIEKL